jgi:hypothetical protein
MLPRNKSNIRISAFIAAEPVSTIECSPLKTTHAMNFIVVAVNVALGLFRVHFDVSGRLSMLRG